MKIQLPSSYICFALGVTLFAAITLIEVPCPIDGGTGVITGTTGLRIIGGVKHWVDTSLVEVEGGLVEVEGELIEHQYYEVGCGTPFNRYTYAVNISVVNEATTSSYGYLTVSFYDPKTVVIEVSYDADAALVLDQPRLVFLEPPVGVGLIFVEIPVETARTIEGIVTFEVLKVDVYETTRIFIGITDEIVCPYCQGTGRVPVTEWLRIKAKVQ